MFMRRAASAVSTLALGAGLLLATTTSATAGPAQADAVTCGGLKELVGSGGHHGASITCLGSGSFALAIDCYQSNTGYQYRHYGNRVSAPGTSTAWCDLGATIEGYGVV
ncbi:hypothetical protein [Streptomyces sp. NPDC005989]|uniref:hypothetical protein n=1 Tax=Streptomyces sp. NPDC005989 TaxID=3156727 RepID=UPI0033C96A60